MKSWKEIAKGAALVASTFLFGLVNTASAYDTGANLNGQTGRGGSGCRTARPVLWEGARLMPALYPIHDGCSINIGNLP